MSSRSTVSSKECLTSLLRLLCGCKMVKMAISSLVSERLQCKLWLWEDTLNIDILIYAQVSKYKPILSPEPNQFNLIFISHFCPFYKSHICTFVCLSRDSKCLEKAISYQDCIDGKRSGPASFLPPGHFPEWKWLRGRRKCYLAHLEVVHILTACAYSCPVDKEHSPHFSSG